MKKLSFLLCSLLLSYGAVAQTASKQLDRSKDYPDLLKKALLFYDAQACGPNVSSYSSFDWRGSCHTGDGNNVFGTSTTYNFNGGWHDAGDHVKFNYPMAFAVYNLASLYIDYKAQIDAQPTIKTLLFKHLDFISDYMIRCHPEANKYVIQIADGVEDHEYWQVPEEQGPGRENPYPRPAYIADNNNPNTNLACANAAAFAALSMAYRGRNDTYSATLLKHARELYDFGYNNPTSYNEAPLPGDAYASTYQERGEFNFYRDFNGYEDEIMVGAAWLYRATKEQRYRDEASVAFAKKTVGGWAPGFGDHQYEATYQMIKASGEQKYKDALKGYVTGILNGTEGNRSPAGMWYVGASGNGYNLPNALGGALMAYRYAELFGTGDANYTAARQFAFQQVNYTLGDNPRNRSYVVGFGNNFPRITHHRAAHSPVNGGPGPIDSNPDLDDHIITGALVMGPLGDDSYSTVRNEIKYNEPALGNNSVLALMAAIMVKETGGTASPTTGNVTVRARGTTGSEQIEIQYKNQRVGAPITLSTSFQEYKVQVDNANGNFKVAFINDNGPEDAEIDWLQVGTTKRQAETRSTNTAVWQDNSCGGSNSQLMNCNGYIDFGTLSSGAPIGQTIWLRSQRSGNFVSANLDAANSPLTAAWATSVQAWERFVVTQASSGRIALRSEANGKYVAVENNRADKLLRANRDAVGSWEQYQWVNNGDGTISLRAQVNDQYVKVTATGDLQANNAGVSSETKFTWGVATNARTATSDTKTVIPNFDAEGAAILRTYPNPASEQLTIEGSEAYQVTLYDVTGRQVMQHDHLKGATQLDIRHLRPGLYFIKLRDRQQHELRQRIVVE